MSLKITQHHTADHNWLRDGILAESTRLATPVDIGGPYHLGDPAHIQEHNRTTIALQTLADAAGCAVQLPPVRALGDTGHEGDHLAWEQALAQIQITEGWNDATGGTVTEYADSRGFRWRAHTFLQSDTFTVKRGLRPFRVLAVGGGGGGGGWDGNWHGNGGSGGYGIQQDTSLTAGDYVVTVGNGGGDPGEGTWNDGQPGGVSSVGKVTANGGPGGDGPGKNGGNYNDGNANGITSDYRNGTPFTYGGGGGANNAGYAGPPNTGHGGGGGHTGRGTQQPGANGGPGGSGIVVVAYQVAPYNEATGGTVTEYTDGGKRYRKHTFTQTSTLSVQVAAKPFTIALVGAGGAGGGGFIGASGYAGTGGGGGGGWEITQPLGVSDYPITVGQGAPATAYNSSGQQGGSTIAMGITVGGGGGGQSGQSRQDSGDHPTPGGQGSASGTSDGGTGSVVTFPGQAIRDKYALATAGAGGGGGGQDGPGGGGAGNSGAVAVVYEIGTA